LYATGDDYLPVVPKWFLNDRGVIPGVSKNGLLMVNTWSDFDFEKNEDVIRFILITNY